MSTRNKYRAAALGGSADEIEHAFYQALQRGDIEALMACWADEDDIFCVHPGGPRLVGMAAIRGAFERMFDQGGHIDVHPTHIRKIESLASAVHNVLERVQVLAAEGSEHAYVLATNVYHKTAVGWRLVAHHASPGTTAEPAQDAASPAFLH